MHSSTNIRGLLRVNKLNKCRFSAKFRAEAASLVPARARAQGTFYDSAARGWRAVDVGFYVDVDSRVHSLMMMMGERGRAIHLYSLNANLPP
jgi:hypothetical protein